MSFIKELNESHDSLKAIALNLFIIPFWYVAIFLFNNEFYKSSDNIIIITMCIVISLISSILFTFLLTKTDPENTSKNIFFEKMIGSIAILTIWLSALIFVIYSLGFLFSIYLYFYWFLVIYFSPLFLFYIGYQIFGDDNTAKQNKKS